MSKVKAEEIVLRLSGASLLRRRLYDKRVYHTFARADGSTCATYMDRNGVARMAPAAKLRVDWDANGPGILMEGPRQNLFENADFETDANGTSAFGATMVRDTAQALRGAASLKVTTTAAPDSGGYFHKRDGTRMAVTAATRYTFQLAVFATGGAVGKSPSIGIEWWNVTPAVLQTDLGSATTLVAGWQVMTVTFLAPAGAVTARAFFENVSNQGVVDYWVDLVSFEQAPFAASVISTSTAALTRALDQLDIRLALDMDRDWSLYLYMKHQASNLASWPDTEPLNDCQILALRPTVDASDGDLAGGLFLQRQNGATQYDYRYFNVVGQATGSFSITPNAQKLVLRHHASDHHLSIGIDNGAFANGAAPTTVSINPQRLLRIGTSAFARIYQLLLSYNLHTQAEMEAAVAA